LAKAAKDNGDLDTGPVKLKELITAGAAHA